MQSLQTFRMLRKRQKGRRKNDPNLDASSLDLSYKQNNLREPVYQELRFVEGWTVSSPWQQPAWTCSGGNIFSGDIPSGASAALIAAFLCDRGGLGA